MGTRIKNIGRWLFAGLLALLVLGAPARAAVEINVASAYAGDNFQTRNLQLYAEDVARLTGGQVRVRIHPAGTLVKSAEIYDAVREGRIEAGEVVMSSLVKENPLFGMDSLPFIVSGYDDASRMWEASRPAIEKVMAGRGLKAMYAVPWPPQNLYSRQPINTVRDFKGLRMRTYSPATERVAELIGAKPMAIDAVGLANAIAEDRLDLMLTSSWTGVETRAWSKLQYYYRVSAWIPKNIVFINKKFFDNLDGETQRKLSEAAHSAEQRGWKLSRESDQQFESQLQANKIQVSTIDPFLRRYLDRIGEKLAREWLKQAQGEELQILLRYTTERSMNLK